MSQAPEPVILFLSYAHEDEELLRQLVVHLSGLKNEELIKTWYDRQIMAGTEWAKELDSHLEQASVILLLVSPDFLASEYCYEIEMKRALQRHAAGEARVIPIILRPCDWSRTLFAPLQALPQDARPITEWENRDTAWNNVTKHLRRVIESLSPLERSAARTALPEVWNVPYQQNPFFIGRDEQLARLHTQLQAGRTTALSQSQAVSGLGGIGKTQLAVEYAYRYQQEYEVVLWARAENKDTLISSYSTIAEMLKLPERKAQEQDVTIQAVKVWLQRHGGWLLILDNADDLDLLPPFLPPVLGGHLLLTTRAWDMRRFAQRIEVNTFPKEQGALFLLRRAGLLATDAPLEDALPAERTRAMQLAQEMGGLPLLWRWIKPVPIWTPRG